jgi:hypothetical protein
MDVSCLATETVKIELQLRLLSNKLESNMKLQCLPIYSIGVFLLWMVSANSMAGAACVVAKSKGHSEAIEWAHSSESAETALFQAKQKLRQRGYKYLFPQATTELKHAYVIIVKSNYKSARGRDRTSYGCGFSETSYDEALWAAIRNLQSYAWGWKPDREGYQVSDKKQY